MIIESFDSREEELFFWWVLELQHRGMITHVEYQPKPFQLSSEVKIMTEKHLKTKIKHVPQKVLAEHVYQADFLIWWNPMARNKIFVDITDRVLNSFKDYPFIANKGRKNENYFSVVDVKGNFNQNDAWRRFSIDQKWVYQKTGIFVQKIIPVPASNGTPATALFKNTFIPHRYQLTDKSGKKRKINFKYQLVDDFLESKGL